MSEPRVVVFSLLVTMIASVCMYLVARPRVVRQRATPHLSLSNRGASEAAPPFDAMLQ